MRLVELFARNIQPIDCEVRDMSETVVIAGPNGVGKTRLLASLLQHFKVLLLTRSLLSSFKLLTIKN